jgi:hypothetical protein
MTTTTQQIDRLETQLDSFDAGRRREALDTLWALAQRGDIPLPALGDDLNLHSHTFYSYNAYGYSPSKFAWLARKRGLYAAGIVDFDVLDGLEEFLGAGRLIGLKTCVSVESRVFVPEFAARVINSPGEPGIAYNMGVGFTSDKLAGFAADFLAAMRRTADQRNRELIGRVNAFTSPVVLDYERDVLPLTPNGNATERHICEAYSKKGDAAFWKSKIGDCPADAGKFQALIRAKTMKRGGVGYVQPGKGSFPVMAEMNRFTVESGAIPTLAWLDGTSDGEACLEELVQTAMRAGTAAVAIIPDRNFTPGVKNQKLQNLYDFVATAENHHLPVHIGTEMNAPGNKFVDDLGAAELEPLLPVFHKGARICYAHSVLQRQAGRGYLSDWARRTFASAADKNVFFEELGRRLQPSQESLLHGLPTNVTPETIFAKLT